MKHEAVNPRSLNGVFTFRERQSRAMGRRRPQHILELVGERLSAAREALELTQAAICDSINVGTTTWNNWESGENLADPLAMVRFADRYGITLDWIYRGDVSGLPLAIGDKIERPTLYLPAGVKKDRRVAQLDFKGKDQRSPRRRRA